MIHKQFQVVKVDVGNFDHNLDITRRYDEPTKNGIPAAVIVSPDDRILYSTKAGELSNAHRMNDDGIYGFFKQAIANSQTAAR